MDEKAAVKEAVLADIDNRHLLKMLVFGVTISLSDIEAEIHSRLGDEKGTLKVNDLPDPSKLTKPKRVMSAKGRKAIAAAQKKRWAAVKRGKDMKKRVTELAKKQSTTPPDKPKRKLSAAGRRAIIAATKRRWAKVKAAKKASAKPKSAIAKTEKPKRTFSKAARKRMSVAQRARWANQNRPGYSELLNRAVS